MVLHVFTTVAVCISLAKKGDAIWGLFLHLTKSEVNEAADTIVTLHESDLLALLTRG